MRQVLKLGLSGSEQELPDKSRVNNQGAPEVSLVEARTANNSLKVDYKGTKNTWSFSWEIISKTDLDLLKSIVDLQHQNRTFLSFVYSDSTGVFTYKTVLARIDAIGDLMQISEYYSRGVTLTLVEA